MIDETQFVKDCEEVLSLLGLDPVPIHYSYACYYRTATDSISMNIEDACTLEYEWYKNVAQYTRIGKSLISYFGRYFMNMVIIKTLWRLISMMKMNSPVH